MEGWVDLGYPAEHRPGVEPAISRSQVRRPTTTLTSHPTRSVKLWCRLIAIWMVLVDWVGELLFVDKMHQSFKTKIQKLPAHKNVPGVHFQRKIIHQFNQLDLKWCPKTAETARKYLPWLKCRTNPLHDLVLLPGTNRRTLRDISLSDFY